MIQSLAHQSSTLKHLELTWTECCIHLFIESHGRDITIAHSCQSLESPVHCADIPELQVDLQQLLAGDPACRLEAVCLIYPVPATGDQMYDEGHRH